MAHTRPFRLVDALLLLVVLLVAGGVRAGYLMSYADNGRAGGPLLVQDPPAPERDLPPDARPQNELDTLIHNLREYRWFGSMAPLAAHEEKTAHYSPGYPWLLSLIAQYLGDADLGRNVRWMQCALGTLTAALYFLFALRAFGSRLVAGLTGLFCALDPFWVINTAQINDGVLASFLLAASLYLASRGIQAHGPFSSLLYGLALAGLALVRATTLPFGFVALIWFLLRSRHESRGWLCAFLAFLGFVNGLAPWIVRNFQTFHEPVPVVDSAYWHLWIGNNPNATGGPLTEKMYFDLPAETADDLRATEEQPKRYGKLSKLVWSEMHDHPGATLQRRVAAFGDVWVGERWFTHDSQLTEEIASGAPANANTVLQWTLLTMLVLALLGWRWTYGWRKEQMPASLALLWLPLPYILSHAEALSGPRLPLDGVLLTYAAFALVCLVPGVGTNLREARKAVDEEPAA